MLRSVVHVAAFVIGSLSLAALILALGAAGHFWFTEVVPFFWAQGNPWPAIVPIAIVSFAAASVIANAADAKNNKDAAS